MGLVWRQVARDPSQRLMLATCCVQAVETARDVRIPLPRILVLPALLHMSSSTQLCAATTFDIDCTMTSCSVINLDNCTGVEYTCARATCHTQNTDPLYLYVVQLLSATDSTAPIGFRFQEDLSQGPYVAAFPFPIVMHGPGQFLSLVALSRCVTYCGYLLLRLDGVNAVRNSEAWEWGPCCLPRSPSSPTACLGCARQRIVCARPWSWCHPESRWR